MEEVPQLQEQQRRTVEVLRNILMGDWEAARIQLDAIDPARAGSWTNVPFRRTPASSSSYAPYLLGGKTGTVAGVFSTTPAGVILHGSRSGVPSRSIDAEFVGTSNYAVNEPNGLGWNATIGDDALALHIPADRWGWNARAASRKYLAVEFAQPVEDVDIVSGQVRACAWFIHEARKRWPNLPLFMPTHAELDGTETGAFDGKSDVYSKFNPKAELLRSAIRATYRHLYG
jgi:hypothetical protein